MRRTVPSITRDLAAAVRRGDAPAVDRCLVELHRLRPAGRNGVAGPSRPTRE